jgi:hypothetical protein
MASERFRLSRNYVRSHFTSLGLMILAAVLLDVVAAVGLSYVDGFGRVRHVLSAFAWPWALPVVGALAVSFVGYYFAYRDLYGALDGPSLLPGQLRAVVAAGFGGFFAHGGSALDQYALEGAGAGEREAKVRVAALGGFEHGALALLVTGAAAVTFATGKTTPGLDFRIPWLVLPVPGFILAFYLAGRYEGRFKGDGGWRGKVAVFVDSVLLLKHLFTNLKAHGLGVLGMMVFWAADMAALWFAMASFGVYMNAASFAIGVATGAVFTRRTGPFAGAGVLMICVPLCLWDSGSPLDGAIAGMFAFRVLSVWAPMPLALAALPTLRRIGSRRRPHAEGKAAEPMGEPALPS